MLYNRCVGLISLKCPLQHFSPLKDRLAEMEIRKEEVNSIKENSVRNGHDISESDLEVGEELYNDSKPVDCPGSKFPIEIPTTEEDIVKCFK